METRNATPAVETSRAIVTRYLGPTDTRGARVKATATNGETATVSWDHEYGPAENHDRAALALVGKLAEVYPHSPAVSRVVRGILPGPAGDRGYVYTFPRAR